MLNMELTDLLESEQITENCVETLYKYKNMVKDMKETSVSFVFFIVFFVCVCVFYFSLKKWKMVQ